MLAFIRKEEGSPMATGRVAVLYAMTVILLASCTQTADAPQPAETAPEVDPLQALIERGQRLELDTPYVPPPGDPDTHHTMGFARTLCSGVFVSGLDPDFAAESIGFFTSPRETRGVVVERDIDYES